MLLVAQHGHRVLVANRAEAGQFGGDDHVARLSQERLDLVGRCHANTLSGPLGPPLLTVPRPWPGAARARAQGPSTSCATRTRRASLARCASGVIALPADEVAKPHCGLIASRSDPMRAPACFSRAARSCADSTRDVFVVTRPSTTTFSSGTRSRAAKVPERSSSYSSSSRSA